MENLEALLPDANKIRRWKVRVTDSKIKVRLRLKGVPRSYEPEELKRSLVDAKIPIDYILDASFGEEKCFSGCSDELGSYCLWMGRNYVSLRISKKIGPKKVTAEGAPITAYQGGQSEADKFGRIPDLLKVVRDYVTLGGDE